MPPFKTHLNKTKPKHFTIPLPPPKEAHKMMIRAAWMITACPEITLKILWRKNLLSIFPHIQIFPSVFYLVKFLRCRSQRKPRAGPNYLCSTCLVFNNKVKWNEIQRVQAFQPGFYYLIGTHVSATPEGSFLLGPRPQLSRASSYLVPWSQTTPEFSSPTSGPSERAVVSSGRGWAMAK